MSMTGLSTFLEYYRNFSDQELSRLQHIYADNALFRDPVHEVQGINALEEYFKEVSTNLTHCSFEFRSQHLHEGGAFVTWTMKYQHPRLKNNQLLTLEGASELKFSRDGRVSYHCDYYDMGAMVYEHVPLVGVIVRWLRRRLSGDSQSHLAPNTAPAHASKTSA
ncbi:nuclear transport factor 2 family protein [Marinibactrum halimedae]|uniref:Transcriptional regulator n=1 Tax=Marinibactrum halimedae TaxID=1444977 RepID=A0AA37TAK1_9GAMM|nr:nuclear transport factor 2 family protein [Marinibactrum halimedae]MCD9457557.1 nuclear transport factor 2 family protein [Marinibactrum halimedae]GLS27977.1 transcriptional regulator [Marinibactrum halimedae]